MNIPDKVNGEFYDASEFTQFKNETENAILSSNQALASSSTQLKQALARYASNGNSFTDNGVANSYNLIPKGNNDTLTTYRDGDVLRFIAGNSNTGASTLAINGLGNRSIKKNIFSDDVSAGDITAGGIYSVYYSLAQDAFELISVSSSSLNGIVLTSIDMTNGGANDLNNIDITWQAVWDAYDYVKIFLDDVNVSNDGQFAFALSSDAGSTWKQFDGLTKEAISWTQTSLGLSDVFRGSAEINLNSRIKTPILIDFSAFKNGSTVDSGNMQGFAFDYAGTTLSNSALISAWRGWDTGSDGLNGHLLRFTHEVGNFTSGTLKIVGYKNP